MSEFKLQNDPTQGNLFDGVKSVGKPVTCLGQTFPDEAARRAHFTALLAEKLKDPAFRAIEGFPIGKDEDILALSDPPYYCACPNPWIGDFIREWEAAKPKRRGKYEREPFAADVSEGKNDPIYNAHSYHTKVPHKAIMRYILHYTEPGDIVFDGFCGTGMTGVAAQMCGDKKTVEELGYKVDEKGNITDPHAEDPKKIFSHLGARKAVLNDLSPAASFIASNYNAATNVQSFYLEATRVLDEVERELGWVYETHDEHGDSKRINYTVWSDVFVCPHCMKDVVFYDVAVDDSSGKVRDEFCCPSCGSTLTKRAMEHAFESVLDFVTGETIKVAKTVPVLIDYAEGKRGHCSKKFDDFDAALIDKIDALDCENWVPSSRMIQGRETRRNDKIGLTHVHHYYSKRNLIVLAAIWKRCKTPMMRLLFTSQLINLSKLNRYRPGVSFPYNPLSGTYYVGSQVSEANVFVAYRNKMRRMIDALATLGAYNVVSTQSLSSVVCGIVDYIFLDPPFGSNLNYSELSSLWEKWLAVETETTEEAIESDTQNKSVFEYRCLIKKCLDKAYAVLKPGGMITVEFSNTSAAIWNSIQTALSESGFVLSNVSSLDKQQGSFKAVTTATAVKQDLVITAYKPEAAFERRFKDEATTEDGVWDFIRTHLEKLPVSKIKKINGTSQLQVVPERDPRILFDKVVAYYIRNGFSIPISAREFQEGLRARFTEDDGMFFLPEQHAEYLKQKAKATALVQAELFVSDESSAISWLRQKLKEKPQKMQTIQPEFMQQIQAWNKYEQQLELRILLEQNFLCYDGRGPVPNPIHAYLSTQYHEFRNLKDEDPALVSKAKNLWYVPDPRDAAEVEKMRERALLKEYDAYKTERKIKTPRLEALRLGFQKSYEEHDYAMIVAIAKKLPADVVETDEKLLRYFDRAQLHLED